MSKMAMDHLILCIAPLTNFLEKLTGQQW